jgi:hypothetical protein
MECVFTIPANAMNVLLMLIALFMLQPNTSITAK